MTRECPVCKSSYQNEEFCPIHFVPLVSPPTAPVAARAEAVDEVTAQAPAAPKQAAATRTQEVTDEGVIQRMKKRLGESFKRKGQDSSAPVAPTGGTAVQPGIELPAELRDKGWTVSGAPVTLHGIDVWPVQRDAAGLADKGNLVVYASGVLTDVPAYQRLLDLGTSAASVHLLAFGTVDRGHRVRACYELITAPGESQTLAHWLLGSPASEERALSLLAPLRDLLNDSAASGVLPITLDPTVVQRFASGPLRIAHYGAMWIAAGGRHGGGVPAGTRSLWLAAIAVDRPRNQGPAGRGAAVGGVLGRADPCGRAVWPGAQPARCAVGPGAVCRDQEPRARAHPHGRTVAPCGRALDVGPKCCTHWTPPRRTGCRTLPRGPD
jgi:hypothetical protein